MVKLGKALIVTPDDLEYFIRLNYEAAKWWVFSGKITFEYEYFMNPARTPMRMADLVLLIDDRYHFAYIIKSRLGYHGKIAYPS